MTTLLFIDDDAIIRRAIQKNIDWESNGFCLEYVARDGIDALEYLTSHQPDIILSDIKMPVMDGIEMARQIKERYPDMLFIFLSGHEDFEYAKQALKLNAFDYLTKPISNEALIEVVKRAETELLNRTKTKMILTNGLPIVRRHYLSKLLQNQFHDLDLKKLKQFDIDISDKIGTTGVINLTGVLSESSLLSSDSIELICDELENLYPDCIFVKSNAAQIFFLYLHKKTVTDQDFTRHLESFEKQVIERLNVFQKLGAKFFFGSIFHKAEELKHSYREAMKKELTIDNSLVEEIKTYIYQNYSEEDLTLREIAAQFRLNHCYMTMLFKKETGTSVYDFLIRTRMEKAKELLIQTDKKIYEIADMVGYGYSQHFSNSFKKYFDCTISEFRKQHRPG